MDVVAPELEDDVRSDGALLNVFTGMGVPGKDRAVSTTVASRRLLSQAEIELLYLTGVPRRFVDAIPEEIFRHVPTIKIGGEESSSLQDKLSGFLEEVKDIQLNHVIAEAVTLQRLYGGSVVVALVDDGADPSEPLNLDRIRSIEGFVALSRHECIPEDVNFLDYSRPNYYRISTSQRLSESQATPTVDITIHSSRVARFDGLYLPWNLRSRNTGWGMSCIQLIWDAYARYESALSGLDDMVQSSDLFVHKMPGLFKKLAGGAGGEAAMRRRLEANAAARSSYGGMAIDTEEDVSFLTRALGNLTQASEPFVNDLQASTGWPASILMGSSPGGLGKEGRFEERAWASLVERWQSVYCRKPVTELYRMLLHSRAGSFKGKPPEKWEVDFPSIFTKTDEEEAALQAQYANIDSTYITQGVLDALEVRNSRFGGTEYSAEITLSESVSLYKEILTDAKQQTELLAQRAQSEQLLAPPQDPNAAVENGSQEGGQAGAAQSQPQPPEAAGASGAQPQPPEAAPATTTQSQPPEAVPIPPTIGLPSSTPTATENQSQQTKSRKRKDSLVRATDLAELRVDHDDHVFVYGNDRDKQYQHYIASVVLDSDNTVTVEAAHFSSITKAFQGVKSIFPGRPILTFQVR